MKKLLVLILMLSSVQIYSCEIPEEMTCENYFEHFDACVQTDQELGNQVLRLRKKRILERRELTEDESIEINVLNAERNVLNRTMINMSREALDYMTSGGDETCFEFNE